MKKSAILLFFCLIFFNAGCSWLSLLDTSDRGSPHEIDCSAKIRALMQENKNDIERRYIGCDMGQVRAGLGEPKYGMVKKAPYIFNRECTGRDCTTKEILSDEVWIYEGLAQIPSCSRTYYSISVYFIDNKVVAVK